MRRTPAEDVVEFLRISANAHQSTRRLEGFSPRQWRYTLQWLDDSGLAFYFLRKLKEEHTAEAMPAWVVSDLESKFAANCQRVDFMSRRFDLLNRRFSAAGIRYAALKGLSLVPQFCPDARLRHQGDFDYLIDEQSLPAAERVLVEEGYRQKPSPSRQEFIFVAPGSGEASRTAKQYDANAPHAVELHLDIWDSSLNDVPLSWKPFSVEHVSLRVAKGLAFPALADEDAFLLQGLHACHHFFAQWIRMSCLYEIAYFLNRRAADSPLWGRIKQRVDDSSVLKEFVVIVTQMANDLFASPVPDLIQDWNRNIRPATRVWVDRYARRWAFCEVPVYEFRPFPEAKLVRFLHQQFRIPDPAAGPSRRDDMEPLSRLSRMAESVRKKPSLVFDPAWWRRHMIIRRTLFHFLGGLRYLCEVPRWLWLTRMKSRSTTANSSDCQDFARRVA